MPKKGACLHSTWTSVFKMSYLVLRSGSCSEESLSSLGISACPNTPVVLPPGPGWKQAGWFPLGHSQGSHMRAPGVAKRWPQGILRNNFFAMEWDFINARLTQPTKSMNMRVTVGCKTIKKEDHTVEAGHWDGKASKPFWNWWAKRTWSKEYFQTGVSGSWRHPHAHSPEGDVINEWYLKEHGSHFRNQSSELKSFVSV